MSERADRTRLIAPAVRRGRGRRTVAPPVERGSTLLNDRPDQMRDESLGPVYGIEDLGAARELRATLADMEGAADVRLVPSGLAAVTTPLMALLRPGDEVLTTDAVYGPTRRFLKRHLGQRGIGVRFHAAEATTTGVLAETTPRTRLLLIESPASLTFEMVDVPALAEACRDRRVLTVMDNTWSAGLAFKPLAHGVDVSVQALTKYVGGHSDLLMGSVATSDARIRRAIAETIEDQGWRVSADDAWLALRGLRTLPLRYAEQARSARVVIDWLGRRPEVSRILYPPSPHDAAHALWSRDWTGGASIFGLVMKGGGEEAANAFLSALELFGLGYSWGGYESLITHETGQLAFRVAPPALEGELIRIHVGLEDPQDLIADLAAGLTAWTKAL